MFDVDDGTWHIEQRIELIRGNELVTNEYTWFLFPADDNYDCVFFISVGSDLIYNPSNCDFEIRPFVYLNFSVQIIGGEKTEQNPYELSY